MRTFLLILIALMAATSVSCQGASFPISSACNASTTAVDNDPSVDVAERYITKSGCTALNFDIDYILNGCRSQINGNRICTCTTEFGNTSSWESAVSNSSGRSCYIDLEIVLTGVVIENTQSSPVVATITHEYLGFIAVGNACNNTEITQGLLTPFATEGVGYLNSSLNVKSNVSGITWSSGSVTVTACGVSSPPVTKVIPSSNTGGTTTTPPTTPSGSSTNSNSTSSPTTVSPVTPNPTSNSSSSSSSSSTGGKGTGTTGNGNGNGASSTVMMHSATAVMVALISAAVTVIGAA